MQINRFDNWHPQATGLLIMAWNSSPEHMASLRESIRPIETDIPLKQVLAEDFPKDCDHLPISGGWGYTQSEAIIFVRGLFPRPSAPDFVGLEYHIAQKIIYEELIVFRGKDNRFSGIDMNLKDQRMLTNGGRSYDCLTFTIACWSDSHWNYLKKEWEDNDAGQRPSFDRDGHIKKRQSARIDYERQLWFDITECFGVAEQ